MVGGWWCADEATKLGCTLIETDLMQGIAAYNEVDCKVMMEIVRYLRDHHLLVNSFGPISTLASD